MGPGDRICIWATGAEGEGVRVSVGTGVGVSVGVGVWLGVSVSVGVALGVPARSVARAACAVCTTTVGKYSGGNGVGTGSTPGSTQPDKSPRAEASKRIWEKVNRFIM